MVEQRVFNAPGANLRELADAVLNWFRIRDYEVQVLNTTGGGYLVQARQPGTWRSILGMASALSLTMNKKGDELQVEVGASKWEDKLAVGAVGAIIFHPLLITTAYGIWKQSTLPDELFQMIEKYLAGRGWLAMASEFQAPMRANETSTYTGQVTSATQSTTCSSCGLLGGPDAKFCQQCGAEMKATSRAVPIKID
jgi:hypothetical protein